jgi:hypothetical protein
MRPDQIPGERGLAEEDAIVEAVRRVHADPELLAEGRRDLPALLDRLNLTGLARHAVAAALVVKTPPLLGIELYWL